MTTHDRPGEVPLTLVGGTSSERGAPGPLIAGIVLAVNQLDVDAIVALPESEQLTAFALLEDAHRVLAGVRSQLMSQAAENMSGMEVTVEGVGTFVRHVRK